MYGGQEKVFSCLQCIFTFRHLLPGGGNYGIVDNCGGPGGLEELIDVYTKGSGKRYEEFKAWFGEEQFDFTVFNKEEINSCLAGDIRMYKSNYEGPQW